MGSVGWGMLRERPLLGSSICFLAGLGLGGCFLEDQVRVVPVLLLSCGLAGALVSVIHWNRTGSFALWLVACVFLGASVSLKSATTEIPGSCSTQAEHRLKGTIENFEKDVESSRSRALVLIDECDGVRSHFRVRLSLHHDVVRLSEGQHILLRAQLKELQPASNPGEFNPVNEWKRAGIVAVATADARSVVPLNAASEWRLSMEEKRESLAYHIHLVESSEGAGALLVALATGLRQGLGEDLEDEFSQSGMAHVLSISGLHVSLLALLILSALRWMLTRIDFKVVRRIDARRWVVPTSIAVMWLYVVFTGAAGPAVRSALMMSVSLSAMGLQRRSDVVQALLCAAVVGFAWAPDGVADLSMQLSYVSVCALTLLSPRIREMIPVSEPHYAASSKWMVRWMRIRENILQVFCASVAVTVSSFPLLASAFHRVSFMGILSNIVALPLCGLLTAWAAIGAAVFFILPVGISSVVLMTGTWVAEVLLTMNRFFAHASWLSLWPSFPTWAVALWLLSLVFWSLCQSRWRWAAAIFPTLILISPLMTSWSQRNELRVTFLSVGHGDAVVIEQGSHRAVIDGGGVPNGMDTGKRFVIPYLRHRGIQALELAVLSHPHPDHALGLAATLRKIPTQRIWLAAGSTDGPLSQLVMHAGSGSKIEEIEQGHAPLWVGKAKLEVLGPPQDRVLLEGVNDRSIVLKMTYGKVSFLLTGDIEEAGEEFLQPGEVTVMKAPHHGSKTSSTAAFLDRVRPQHVVFSVGKNNRFHFPNEDVVHRYQALGTVTHRTDKDGAVTFVTDGNKLQVEHFLNR